MFAPQTRFFRTGGKVTDGPLDGRASVMLSAFLPEQHGWPETQSSRSMRLHRRPSLVSKLRAIHYSKCSEFGPISTLTVMSQSRPVKRNPDAS